MKKVIHKWFWAWDFDKEEKWLNEMAEEGLALTGVRCGKYTFEDAAPGEYAIRLEMLKNSPAHAQSQEYIRFVEETGAEYIGSVLRWVYFRKKKENGEFELYSDIESHIGHLNGILMLLIPLAAVNLVNGFHMVNIFLEFRNEANLFVAGMCFTVTLLFGVGIWKISGKKRKLKGERQLFE